jgi:succinate dehydrogenase/fumarate reductase flavoprotein subunit
VHLATTSGPEATGDGVKLAEKMGAKLVDMDQIQVRMHIYVSICLLMFYTCTTACFNRSQPITLSRNSARLCVTDAQHHTSKPLLKTRDVDYAMLDVAVVLLVLCNKALSVFTT